ncbi:MAG: PilZ domain-containing protein [Candidatus Omnitrophica bacterium]|nr:PilZ domain-containing protein [Candidatus Omnitrophota bacterium]
MLWQERRSTIRHAIELPVRYRVLVESKQKDKATFQSVHPHKTKNISDNGLLFLSSEYFKLGTLLQLTLPVRDKVFTIEGRVVHSSQDRESSFFRTGIYFANPDSVFKVKMAEQLHQIDEYRKSLSRDEGRVITEEEAAHRWIDEHSRNFAEFYKYF